MALVDVISPSKITARVGQRIGVVSDSRDDACSHLAPLLKSPDRQPQQRVLAGVTCAQNWLLHIRGLHADRRHRRQGLHRRPGLRPRRSSQESRPRRQGGERLRGQGD
jgi:hypothetical protein